MLTSVRRRARAVLDIGQGTGGEQLLVTGGQLFAGVGNLAFSLVVARVLEPRDFAQLTAFLSLYLLVHLPTGSLSAGGALDPARARAIRRRTLVVSVGGLVAVVVLAAPLASVLALPVGLLLALAATVPVAGLLALARGVLFGTGGHGRAAVSLVAEPVVRLTLGVALAVALGAVGGAVGVVIAGYAAWAVAATGSRPVGDRPAAEGARRGLGWTMLVFLVLAVVQKQDVLLANRVLDDLAAGQFAVVATIGGAAALATVTIPTVLLPRAAARTPDAVRFAVGLAAAMGAAGVAVIAIAPELLVGAFFGSRYAPVGPLVVPYVAAMAVFGVLRVLIAQHVATRSGKLLAGAVAAIAVGQAAAVTLLARTPGEVVAVTCAAVAAIALVLAVDHLVRRSRTTTGKKVAA